MPLYEISEATIDRLNRYAKPFVDTLDTVINRFADAYEASLRNGDGSALDEPITRVEARVIDSEPSATNYDPASPPDLTYTKLLSAKLNGRIIATRVNWNGLLKQMIQIARARAKKEDDLHRLISVNFLIGKKEDEGFEYLPDVNLSVQGQDTNDAWKGILHISRQLDIPVDLVFMWRHKPKAAFPGKTGRLVSN
jgi:hypothetical protein